LYVTHDPTERNTVGRGGERTKSLRTAVDARHDQRPST